LSQHLKLSSLVQWFMTLRGNRKTT